MLSNAYFVAKIGADTAENEQHFVEILPIGRRVAEPSAMLAEMRRSAALELEVERLTPRVWTVVVARDPSPGSASPGLDIG